MQMSRLEESRTLLVALRLLVRTVHEKGDQIAFPTPEAMDGIHLRCNNLPTRPDDLLGLVLQVFARRGVAFDLNKVCRDFIRSHGRVVFDSGQQWPHCYTVVRN